MFFFAALASSFKMIDVSIWQGTIDFNQVKASGITHVMIRSSFGSASPSQVDKQFVAHIESAIAAGMTIGIYHYGYATTPAEAEGEADICLSTIAPYRDHISFPVA